MAVLRTFSLLVKNIWHADSRIFKMNLELVRMMLSLWKDCLAADSMDFTVVDDLLSSTDKAESLGALRLLAELLEQETENKLQLMYRQLFVVLLLFLRFSKPNVFNFLVSSLAI
jgi:hypothetical protein